ncbi:glycoside hydrolase family 76 protein [Psychromicrobium xiongbiense]|uniref:glycoside hydrolase family 76 protein n=1 Tax=Psychromicrobium xiongbiense TaxID=3051184 RepID=UPI0025555E62|nr:glycoside hydrolase family 76 protein [Psychromicrobium sp. YIM S02556]
MDSAAEVWAGRAAIAEQAVNRRFGHRVLGLPGTWLGRVAVISGPLEERAQKAGPRGEWHYWWQAHYLECLVDAQWRRAVRSEPVDLHRARALLRGIRLRNFSILVNSYYDDMAWLALAVGRAEQLSHQEQGRSWAGARLAGRTLVRQLRSALTPELGGGLFWSRKRDYKNTAVNGPAALYFARTGDHDRAQAVLDWLEANLWDAERGVYVDGIHLRSIPGQAGTRPEREETVWSYNQGPVLAALLAEAGSRPESPSINQAVRLIDGVSHQLAHDGVLRLHGDDDRGLFTGILLRYLSVAARHSGLPEAGREAARDLVFRTAEALWASRSAEDLFTLDLGQPAAIAYPAGTPVQLSTQLQAWMAFESAHQLAHSEEPAPGATTTEIPA